MDEHVLRLPAVAVTDLATRYTFYHGENGIIFYINLFSNVILLPQGHNPQTSCSHLPSTLDYRLDNVRHLEQSYYSKPKSYSADCYLIFSF